MTACSPRTWARALHICHVSTAGSAEIIRWAKSKGWPVTAEVTPHHLLLTDELAEGYDPVFKVNPPLRTAADVAELRRALADGTIDCVATDHAPHPVEAKETEWSEAAFGMTGLETALRVVQLAMVDTGLLDWPGVADRMSVRPARIGRLAGHGARSRSAGPPTSPCTTRRRPPRRWARPARPRAATPRSPGWSCPAGWWRPSCAARPPCSTESWPDMPPPLPPCWSSRTAPRCAAPASARDGETFGEMVFNTGMTGYQETLTDPSYCRQIVAMTAPHVGNTGVNDEDPESRRVWVSGYVVREPARIASSWRATGDLDTYLRAEGVPGIAVARHPAADQAGPRAGRHAGGDQHGGDRSRPGCSSGCWPARR